MSNRPEERLDRRDFMIASIATVGASAALAADAGSANAQGVHAGTATSPARLASGAPPATVYTGDTIEGKKVVSASAWQKQSNDKMADIGKIIGPEEDQ